MSQVPDEAITADCLKQHPKRGGNPCRHCKEDSPDHLRWCPRAPLIPDQVVRRLLKRLVIFAAIVLLIVLGVTLGTHAIEMRTLDAAHFPEVTYSKLTLEAIKMVLTGSVVALIVAFIPIGFTTARDNFERMKESRIAFSRAQTGVDYLAATMSALDYREAGILLQRLHVWKHRAQLYDELQLHLQRRGDGFSNIEWADRMFARLCRARRCLQERAGEWDDASETKRLKWLHESADLAEREWKKAYPDRPAVQHAVLPR